MKKRVTVRVNPMIILIVTLLFVAIIAKLSYIVLNDSVDGVNLDNLASSIITTQRTLYANRGTIYDALGEELATSVNSYTVIAYLSESRTEDEKNPKHVVDKKMTAEALAPIINMSEERILKLLNQDKYQVELGPGGRGITERVKSQIESLELPGIGFVSEAKKRYYNQGTFASFIVGYAKQKEDGSLHGELGVEGYFDEALSGVNGHTKYLKYSSGNYQIPNTPEETEPASDGQDIYLTIQRGIQFRAENAITKIEEFNPEWAIVTVMDAETGAIVASATSPNFDPNDTNTITEYMNPLVSKQYEPGSVMKIFSFASAIESGNYKGDETYKSGAYKLNDKVGTVIRDADRNGWGTISFDTGFAYSSNVAATILALRMGKDTLTKYYTDLGFGSKTGIELSNEMKGEIDINYLSELSNASFGQGISVTPIKMLKALSAITNDGNVLKPYIVDKIVDSEGNVTYDGKRTVVNKVYSTNTVNKMQKIMYDVIYNGLSKSYRPKKVEVMGKTGTAQVASPHGGYLTGKYDYVKSFAGIFPADKPKYIIYVAASRAIIPTTKAWGSIITTCIDEIATYANLVEEEDIVNDSKSFNVNNYISKKVDDVKEKLKDENINIITIGNGKYVVDQYPNKGTIILTDSKLFLLTNSSEKKLADVTKWSINDLKSYASIMGINLEYSGYGYVVSQDIAPGSPVVDGMTLKVELAS